MSAILRRCCGLMFEPDPQRELLAAIVQHGDQAVPRSVFFDPVYMERDYRASRIRYSYDNVSGSADLGRAERSDPPLRHICA